MYGTVAKTRVKPENRDKLHEVMEKQSAAQVTGFVAGYMLYENDSDTAWLFAIFEDRATYDRNADDPAQNERYVEYRALMEDEPEWHDGEIKPADSHGSNAVRGGNVAARTGEPMARTEVGRSRSDRVRGRDVRGGARGQDRRCRRPSLGRHRRGDPRRQASHGGLRARDRPTSSG